MHAVTRLLREFAAHRALLVAATLALVLMGIVAGHFIVERTRIDRDLARLSQLHAEFERRIGYGGFIHDFKNAVLRPDEPAYLMRARTQLPRLLSLLDLIEQFSTAASNLPVDDVRSTLTRYSEQLARVAADGKKLSARELDKLVRVDDAAAVAGLQDWIQRLTAEMISARRAVQIWLWGGLAGAVLLAVLAMVLYLVVMERSRSQRERLASEIVDAMPLEAVLVDEKGLVIFTNVSRNVPAQLPDDSVAGVGRRFADELRIMGDAGYFEDSTQALAILDGDLPRGGFSDQIALGNGKSFVRTVTRLSSGQSLVLRQDVTKRLAREREIHELNVRQQLVLNMTVSGIVALTSDRQVLLINRAARYLLGDLMNAVPFAWPDSLTFRDAETLAPLTGEADPVSRALRGQALHAETVSLRSSGGVPRYLRLNSAVAEGDAHDFRVVLALDDITSETLHGQQVERTRRLEALGQLSSGIAHDFNNLLSTVLGATQLVHRETDNKQHAELLEIAITTIRRGADLTDRLLAFARQEPGRAVASPVNQTLDSLRALAHAVVEASVEVVVELSPDAELMVYCDLAQLESALLNLVINSRDAIVESGKGSLITVRARAFESRSPEDIHESASKNKPVEEAVLGNATEMQVGAPRFVEISVSDDGPGMDPEVQRRATDPFFTTKAAHAGTGLGLTMVHAFVQQVGGEVRVYSEPGKGTTVRLLVPRASVSVTEGVERPSRAVIRGTGQSVLLVEDEPGLRGVLSAMLSTLGYQPVVAANAPEALEKLRQGQGGEPTVDVLLTDIVMPGGMNGFELAVQVRAQYPQLPVVYMSGYAGIEVPEADAVAAPMLTKPCLIEDLADALNDVLCVDTAG